MGKYRDRSVMKKTGKFNFAYSNKFFNQKSHSNQKIEGEKIEDKLWDRNNTGQSRFVVDVEQGSQDLNNFLQLSAFPSIFYSSSVIILVHIQEEAKYKSFSFLLVLHFSSSIILTSPNGTDLWLFVMNQAAESAQSGCRRQPGDYVSQELVTTDAEILEGGKGKRNCETNCRLRGFVWVQHYMNRLGC